MAVGYSIDEFCEMRRLEYEESYRNHLDLTFHSCEHCAAYRNHCKKLVKKLAQSSTVSWSCGDYTKCQTWHQIESG